MSFKFVKIKKGKAIRAQKQPFGVNDGVVGAWINPSYIENQNIDYTPGTKQYYEQTSKNIRRAYEIYQMELASAHER